MGERIRDRYELLASAGAGGQGEVYKALDHQHDRLVALKRRSVSSDAEREGILREARILLGLTPHPGLPLVREDFFEGDRYFVAMDWISGGSLEHLLAARGAPGLAPEDVLPALAEVAAALDHLHAHDPPVLHRDVKPANIIIAGGGRAVLVDFGISSPSIPSDRAGTHGYTAPEVAAGGEITTAADIYSLAATAFALLTGGPPAIGGAPVIPGVPHEEADRLMRAIRRGLASDPLQRPRSATEFVARLSNTSHGRTSMPSRDERRLVTALSASIVELSGALRDPEERVETLDPILRALGSIAERNGAHVTSPDGDAVLCFFGVPAAHEDDATRALRTAIEMHDEMQRLFGERALYLQIGLSTGHVVGRSSGTTSLDVLGDVIESARFFQRHAPLACTYVGGNTRGLAGDGFELDFVGGFAADGKSIPQPAWRLVRMLAGTGRRPHRAPFVGRERELAVIDDVLAGVLAGRGSFVAVVGEPGVGRSRLFDEARDRASRLNALWLEARSQSLDRETPYRPFVDVLRSFAGAKPGDPLSSDELRTALNEVGSDESFPHFARLLGLGGASDALEPEAVRRALHAAFIAWIEAVTTRGALVLAIEDAHWMDASSLALCSEIVRRCARRALTLVLTSRAEGRLRLDDVADAVPDGARRSIELAPMDPADVALLLDRLLGARPPRALVELVAARAAGNPFFVEEIVGSLIESGALTRRDDAWQFEAPDDVAIPLTVEGSVSARIDQLPEAAAEILNVASVIGRRAALPLLLAVADGIPDPVESIEDLARSGLVDRTRGEVAFRHGVVQDVVYARLVHARKSELHRRIADELERSGGDVGSLAHHLSLGDPGPRAVAALVRAGTHASALFANAEAIGYLRRATELAEPAEASELSLTLAGLLELTGAYDEALAVFDEVRQATDDVRAWAGCASVLRKRGDYDGAIARLKRAPEDPRLDLERAWTFAAAGKFADAMATARAALAAGADDAVRARLLIQLARAETAEGELDAALASVREADAILERIDDGPGRATALRLLGGVHLSRGELDDAASALTAGLAFAERVGNAEEIGGCLLNLGLVELSRGRIDESIAANERASEEFERIAHGAGRVLAYGNLGEALMQRGDLEGALGSCERALALAREIGHTIGVADSLQTIASIHLRRAEYDDAVTRAEEAADAWRAIGSEAQRLEQCEALAAEAHEARARTRESVTEER